MSDWDYKVHGAPVDFVEADGTTRRYERGDVFETDDPCEMLRFIGQVSNPWERRRGSMASLEEAARKAGCLGAGDNAGTAPQSGTSSTPTQSAPPAEGDSAAAQGAPDVQPTGEVDHTPSAPDEEPSPEPTPGQASSTHGGERSHEESDDGDPVNLFRGAFVLQEVDLVVPTPLMPLVMARSYRSGAPMLGTLGYNWDHVHNQYLRELANGDVARWDGRLHEDVFRAVGSGFEPPRGVFETLTRLAFPAQGYEIGVAEGLVQRFERPIGWTDAERIPLVEVRDRHGNRLRYEYDAEDRASRVWDDDDRSLVFRYGSCGGLEEVEDHSGRVVRYEWDEDHVRGVRLPATSDHPEGTWRRYRYAHHGLPAYLRHGIVAVEDGNGRTYVQNEYHTDPTSWSYGRVCRQLYGDYEYQYRYTQLQWVPPRPEFVNTPSVRVEVMAPDRGVSVYTFNYRGDLLDHRMRLVRDKSFRVVVRSFEYDEAGNRTRIRHPDGREDLRVYAANDADPRMRGRLQQRELRARAGFPSPSRIVWRGEWEPRFQLLRRERSETGAETVYRYDFDAAPGPAATGRLEEVRHPDVTLPDGSIQNAVTRFEVAANGQVTAVISPTGDRNEIDYVTSGPHRNRVRARRTDATGAALQESYDYDAAGFVRLIRDASGAEQEIDTNSLGRVEQRRAADVGGDRAPVVTHYDSDGNIGAIERPRGSFDDGTIGDVAITDEFQRDVLGHVTRFAYGVNTGSPRVFEQCVDHRGLPTSLTDPSGARFATTFDERGLLLEQESLDAAAKRRQVYDTDGRITRLYEGPLEDAVTGFEYDDFGRLRVRTTAGGAAHSFMWGRNDLLEQEEISGNPGDGSFRVLSSKRYEYDERARLIRVTELSFDSDPSAAVELATEYFYDASNRLDRVIDPRGATTRTAWDGAGRLIEREDPVGNLLLVSYDAATRSVTTERRDRGVSGVVTRITSRHFDARGRLSREVDANGSEHRMEYDDRNLPIRVIEPEGVERRRTFGQLGELVEHRVDPAGLDLVSRYAYDDRSLPVSFVDPTGEETTYDYDALGRLVATTFPGGATWTREYGSAGRVVRESHPGGGLVDIDVDAVGRLRRLEGGGSAGVDPVGLHEYRYDALGRLVRAEAAGVVVERRYDSLGRMRSESRDGTALGLTYDDLAGSIDRSWPDGRRESITLDASGLPSQVQRVASGGLGDGSPDLARFTLEGPARLGRAVLLGGLRQLVVFDAGYRTISYRWQTDAGDLERIDYRYDRRHRRRVVHARAAPAQLRSVNFDTRDRVVDIAEGFTAPALGTGGDQAIHDADIANVAAASTGAAQRFGFAYDDADSRTVARTTGAPDRTYTYGPGHRLASAGGETIAHTAHGTRASDGSRSYRSDGLGRITQVLSSTGANVVEIAYDPLGRPGTLRESGGLAREFRYFGSELWQEDAGGAPDRQFSQSPFQPGPLAVHLSGRTLVPLIDGVGSIVGYADSSLQVVERLRFEPFGEPSFAAADGTSAAGSVVGLPPVFGAMRHTAAGLYVTSRRLMDPQHGVFLSPDPLGYVDSPNPYVYAGQDPIDMLDPEGELFWFGLLAVVAVGALVSGGVNAVRQGIQIAEGSRDEFSWGELGLSAGFGAVAAPLLVAAPELAVPLAAWGFAGGIGEMADGNYATGIFDIATSVAPFGFKGPRNSTFGSGTRYGQWRGMGESASWSTRFGRFNQIGESTRVAFDNARYRRFYRGTTYYEALEASDSGLLNIDQIIARQRSATAPPARGPGLYFTETLYPGVEGSAPYWADVHGGRGVGGGPAVLEARLGRAQWWWTRRQPGVVSGARQADVPVAPSTLETFIPPEVAPQFNQSAAFRTLAWPPEPPPTPNFSPLWPSLLSPQLRLPESQEPGQAHALAQPAPEAAEAPGDTGGKK